MRFFYDALSEIPAHRMPTNQHAGMFGPLYLSSVERFSFPCIETALSSIILFINNYQRVAFW